MTRSDAWSACGRWILFISLFVLSVAGCKKDDSSDSSDLVGNWFKRSDFEGVSRSAAVVFTIGTKAYVGLGYDGKDRLTDFWEYDSDINNWVRKADFPGAARTGAVAFAIGSKGYVGTGYDGTTRLRDFYEFDPSTNTWTPLAEFGGTARYGAVGFAISGKGYLCSGDDGNFQKDLWEYDRTANQWTQKVSLSGAKRRSAVAFVISGKAYVCTGVNNGVYESDLWAYDPTTNAWTGMRAIANVSEGDYDDDYSDIVGTNKVAFTVGTKGYVATGGKGTTGTSVWEYDPSTDLWTSRTGLEGSARMEAVGFAIGSYGYVTTGRSGSSYFDDAWGFEPGATQVDLDKPGAIVDP
jgi:hypothetical protein